MSHFGWFALAIALAAAEIAIEGSFYLVLMAIAAGAVGALAWAWPELPGAAEWVLFAIGSAALLATCRKPLRERVHGGMARTEEAHWMVGRMLTIDEAMNPGETSRTSVGGSGWTLRNIGDRGVGQGARVRVERVDGVTLEVREFATGEAPVDTGTSGTSRVAAADAAKREDTRCSTQDS